MKRTFAFFAVSLLALASAAPALASPGGECKGTPGNGAVRLSVDALGLRNASGEVAFTLYGGDPDKFLAKHGKFAINRVRTTAPVTRACFWVPPGQYALALYHDENGDHKFNRTLWIAKEGFGFSNDAPTTFGLPSFGNVRFTVPAGGSIVRIKMRYSR